MVRHSGQEPHPFALSPSRGRPNGQGEGGSLKKRPPPNSLPPPPCPKICLGPIHSRSKHSCPTTPPLPPATPWATARSSGRCSTSAAPRPTPPTSYPTSSPATESSTSAAAPAPSLWDSHAPSTPERCTVSTWRSPRSPWPAAAAEAGGHANATFHVGDVTKLPFEDNFFDAVLRRPDARTRHRRRPRRGQAGTQTRRHHRRT